MDTRVRPAEGNKMAVASFANLLMAVFLACSVLSCATWDGSVGAVFARDNPTGRVFVRDAPEDMAGAKAGLLVGDELIAIDGRSVTPMTPPEVQHSLEGRVGTKVRLTVLRHGNTVELTVERGPFKDPSHS